MKRYWKVDVTELATYTLIIEAPDADRARLLGNALVQECASWEGGGTQAHPDFPLTQFEVAERDTVAAELVGADAPDSVEDGMVWDEEQNNHLLAEGL